jgi:hypothetical protein
MRNGESDLSVPAQVGPMGTGRSLRQRGEKSVFTDVLCRESMTPGGNALELADPRPNATARTLPPEHNCTDTAKIDKFPPLFELPSFGGPIDDFSPRETFACALARKPSARRQE